MPRPPEAAASRYEPDSVSRRRERPCDRHAAGLGVLGSVSLAAAPSVSIGPAGFASKPCMLRGSTVDAPIRAAQAGPSAFHVFAAPPA
jgi:hypothetical protein